MGELVEFADLGEKMDLPVVGDNQVPIVLSPGCSDGVGGGDEGDVLQGVELEGGILHKVDYIFG